MNTKSITLLMLAGLLVAGGVKQGQPPSLNDPEAVERVSNVLENRNPVFLHSWEKKLQEMSCKKELLELFQIAVPEDWTSQPVIASNTARQVCRRNQVTCCTFAQLKSVRHTIDAGKLRLQRTLEPIHEMLAMFVGKISDIFFAHVPLNLLKQKGCEGAMELYGSNGNGAAYFYSKQSRNALRAELQGLFTEFPVYFKRNLRFFRNFVCSVCHPREKDFLELTPDRLKITASMDTCAGVMDIYDYELRLAHAYKHKVEPMVRAARCVQSGKLEAEAKPYLTDLVKAEFKAFSCLTRLAVDNQDCRDLCQHDVFSHKMKFHLLARARDALGTLFPIFSHIPIDEFYERTKHHSFDSTFQRATFYPGNNKMLRGLRRQVVWDPAPEGLSLFTNHFSMERFEGIKREDDI